MSEFTHFTLVNTHQRTNTGKLPETKTRHLVLVDSYICSNNYITADKMCQYGKWLFGASARDFVPQFVPKFSLLIKSKKDGKDQEPIQSSHIINIGIMHHEIVLEEIFHTHSNIIF